MSDSEESVEQRLQSLREDWETITRIKGGLGRRVASVKRDGVSWRRIHAETTIPMTDARRWAKPHLSDEAGAA